MATRESPHRVHLDGVPPLIWLLLSRDQDSPVLIDFSEEIRSEDLASFSTPVPGPVPAPASVQDTG